MTTWFNPGSPYTYGMGLRKKDTQYGDAIGHGGMGHATQTFPFHFRESGVTIAARCNVVGGKYNEMFREDLFDDVAKTALE